MSASGQPVRTVCLADVRLPRRPRAPGGNAIALIEIDGDLPADVLAKVRALPQVQSAKPLRF